MRPAARSSTILGIIEDTGADEEPETFRSIERKHAATTRDHVENQLRVLPILKLAAAHVKWLAVHLAQLHIRIANQELATRIAHRGAAIAAAPRLVEHQRPMLFTKDPGQMDCQVCCQHLLR